MSLIRINRNPSGRQLLVFGLAWLGFLGAGGVLSWVRGRHPAAEILWLLAGIVPLAGAVWPAFLRYAFLGLSYATYPVGYLVSNAFLVFVYYLVISPLGLTMRLFGYDPLARRFDAHAQSYWTPREKKGNVESYFNQH